MNNLPKRGKVADLFLIVTCLVIIAAIGYYFFQQKEKEEASKANEYALKEKVFWDLTYNYEKLREIAPSWNTIYAKLTLNDTRDTIKRAKYTVRKLSVLHNEVLALIDNYKQSPFIKDLAVDKNQILDLFPISNESQQLLSVYRIRQNLHTYTNELNQIYASTIAKNNPKDSVLNTFWMNSDTRYHSYFRALKKLDELIYDLLAEEYPQSLGFVINNEKKFLNINKERLLNQQIAAMSYSSKYRVYTPVVRNLKQKMTKCFLGRESQTQNFEFEVNNGKVFLLVVTDTLKNKNILEVKNKIAKDYIACFEKIKEDYHNKLYLYIESPGGIAHIKSPQQSSLIELTEQTKNNMYSFYDDNSFSPYFVEGTFSPYYLWYPKTVDEAIKEMNNEP